MLLPCMYRQRTRLLRIQARMPPDPFLIGSGYESLPTKIEPASSSLRAQASASSSSTTTTPSRALTSLTLNHLPGTRPRPLRLQRAPTQPSDSPRPRKKGTSLRETDHLTAYIRL